MSKLNLSYYSNRQASHYSILLDILCHRSSTFTRSLILDLRQMNLYIHCRLTKYIYQYHAFYHLCINLRIYQTRHYSFSKLRFHFLDHYWIVLWKKIRHSKNINRIQMAFHYHSFLCMHHHWRIFIFLIRVLGSW